MCVDEANGLLYVLCGSGNFFGSTNMNDVYELNLSMAASHLCRIIHSLSKKHLACERVGVCFWQNTSLGECFTSTPRLRTCIAFMSTQSQISCLGMAFFFFLVLDCVLNRLKILEHECAGLMD
jgi:hypothetical protein